jgi:hypothetical protein
VAATRYPVCCHGRRLPYSRAEPLHCGYSSALGDIDHDGNMDMVIGCLYGTVSTYTSYGSVAVIYGE